MRAGDVELNEDVLGVVVEFVGMRDATAMRATCKQLRDVAARVAWREREYVWGPDLSLWRACFPRALAVGVKKDDPGDILPPQDQYDDDKAHEDDAQDEDLQWVEGVLDVKLSECEQITDAGLAHLGSVTTLDIRGCKITNEGLRHLGHVTTLDLSWCKLITDEGLRHLGSVRKLDIGGCPKVTKEGIARLRSRGASVYSVLDTSL